MEKRNFLWVLIVIAVMGFLFQAFATQRGIGVSNDTVGFIWAARNLDKGLGIAWDNGRGGLTPVVLWPPLYPSLLAAWATGVDPLDAARWLNGLLFAGIILVAGATLYAYSARNAWLAGFGAALLLVSPVMIQIHAMAWTEPQAFFFGLLGICLLARYLDTSKRPYLLASAVSMGLAFLTRYVGAAFIGGGLLGLCFLGQRRWGRRIADAVLFGAISCLGTALWLVRNARVGGSSTGRAISAHVVSAKQFAAVLYVLSRWVAPDSRPELTLSHNPVRMANLLLVAAGVALACFLALRRKTVHVPEADAPRPLRFLPHLLIGYVLCYGLILAVTLSFLDASTGRTRRILSPLYTAFLLLSLCAMNWLLPVLKGRRVLATAVASCASRSEFSIGRRHAVGRPRRAGRRRLPEPRMANVPDHRRNQKAPAGSGDLHQQPFTRLHCRGQGVVQRPREVQPYHDETQRALFRRDRGDVGAARKERRGLRVFQRRATCLASFRGRDQGGVARGACLARTGRSNLPAGNPAGRSANDEGRITEAKWPPASRAYSFLQYLALQSTSLRSELYPILLIENHPRLSCIPARHSRLRCRIRPEITCDINWSKHPWWSRTYRRQDGEPQASPLGHWEACP